MSVADARWAAVIVNYESGELLIRCIDALRADDSAGPVDIVVVDNGSTDGSVAALRVHHPDVPVVEPHANLGYGRAANLGIAATRAPFVLVCNPDTELHAGSARAVLSAFGADPRVAIVGPRILNPDGTTYPSARIAPTTGVAVGHAVLGQIAPQNRFTREYRQSDAAVDEPRDVDWVSGAALWFRRSALDRAGGWDERYFMFLEDVDVCRTMTTAGDRVRYEPAAQVTHVVGASRAGAPMQSILAHHRSAYRYVAKWWSGPRRCALPAAAAFLGARAAVAAGAAAVNRRSSARPETRVPTG